ncbi:MAG: sensor histidine kinase [Cellulosilyticaceae bacterium]
MDKKANLLGCGIYLGKLSFVGLILFYNQSSKALVFLAIALIVLWTLEVKGLEHTRWTEIIWLIEYVLMMGVCSIESTGMAIVLVLFRVGDIVLRTSFRKSAVITCVGYIGYMITMAFSHGSGYGGLGFLMTTMNFSITYLMVAIMRYQIVQKEKNYYIAEVLRQKTEELEKAYEKLQDMYEEQEEMVILKERNRIAGEIHDTVGHRLTTAIVQLEASKRLMNHDKEKALEKLEVAQNQVREGLQDIRGAVRTMKEGHSLLPFKERMEAFLQEVSDNNDIEIRRTIEPLPNLETKVENTLFRALQEGITNGIRHGKSTWFTLEVGYVNKELQLQLKDGGIGNEKITYGFGLHNMERKVKALEGTLEILSKKGVGTTLVIRLPIEEEIA